MTTPYTIEEVRIEFLEKLNGLISAWDTMEGKYTQAERMEGLVHSILATLDGCTLLPAFQVVISPHRADRAYHQGRGERWYPVIEGVTLDGDIRAGVMLHEEWGSFRMQKAEKKKAKKKKAKKKTGKKAKKKTGKKKAKKKTGKKAKKRTGYRRR